MREINLLKKQEEPKLTQELLDETFSVEIDELEKMELQELLEKIFPEVTKQDIQKLLENLTLEKVRDFFDNNMITEYKKKKHTGSYFSDFLEYLSVSVGGPIQSCNKNTVYLEIVLPDSDVKVHAQGCVGEKEALVKKN